MATSETKEELDVFGKPLEVSSQEKAVLGESVRVFLHRVLQVETHAKKGDPTEPKAIVITSARCFVISRKPTIKLETSFNFLKINLIECTENKLIFHIEGESRPREFLAERKNGVTIVGLILAQLKNLFPVTTIDSLIKVSYGSDSINSEVSLLHETLRQAMESVDPNSLESFITIYGFLCDLHGIPYIAEISSYLRATYLTHGFRELDLCDFEHFQIRDLLPLISALRHNNYFEGLSLDGIKLTNDVWEEIAQTLVHSQTLKKLKLVNCFLKPEVLFQYCVAWKSSSKSVLSHLDLSKNILDEKLIDNFCTALESLQHGLQHLSLSNCKISAKVGSQLAHSMKQNPDLLYSLTHFDLSENPLGPDSQPALAFLKEPQTVTCLNLSKCGLNFELVFPILIRGCQQHLRELNLSQNRLNKKTNIISTGQLMQQFFSSAISLQSIDLSDCKLPPDLAIAVMEGLSVNPNIEDTSLNLSLNELGHGLDVRTMSNSLSRLKRVSTLDISNTGIDHHMPRLLEALGLNRSIHHLSIGQNFEGKGSSRVDGVRQLCRLVKSHDCCLETLNIADSKLKEMTSALLNSLISNDSIVKLDISGNGMGTPGLRALVKLLLSGTQLQVLHCGNNDISAAGFNYIADALEHNYTLLSLPIPVYDITHISPKDSDLIESALPRIQSYLCRNHSDEKLRIKAAKIHQLRLLTTAQQSALISREVVQLEEMLLNLSKLSKKPTGYDEEVAKATAVKEEANKVLQLVDSLYSPHKESQQYEAIAHRIETVLEREVEQMYREFVQENIEVMVTQSVKTCPLFLSDTDRETLRQISRRELQNELIEAKKAVTRKTTPEMVNHISGMNLETAAVISELIVDKTLDELEGCTGRLHSMSERVSGSSSGRRLSKIFSFRTKDQQEAKRRRRRDDEGENGEEIVLPSNPLTTDGPTLHHYGNQRPRPARRHQHHRPAALKRAAATGPASIWDTPSGGGTDEVDTIIENINLPQSSVEDVKPSDKEGEKEKEREREEKEREKEREREKEKEREKKEDKKEEQPTVRPITPLKPPSKQNDVENKSTSSKETTPTPKETTPKEEGASGGERKPVDSSNKRKSGFSKLFGSRKEKDRSSPSPAPPTTSPTPPTTSPTPPTTSPTPPTTSPTPPTTSPTPSLSEEDKESVGKEETNETKVTPKRTSELIADEYIVVSKSGKNPPPAVKSKPQKPKVDEEGEEGGGSEGGGEKWKPPSHASTSVGQLANVLKQGGIPQLKPLKTTGIIKEEEETTSSSDNSRPMMPPPVAHKPKRPSTKAKSPDQVESNEEKEKEKSENKTSNELKEEGEGEEKEGGEGGSTTQL